MSWDVINGWVLFFASVFTTVCAWIVRNILTNKVAIARLEERLNRVGEKVDKLPDGEKMAEQIVERIVDELRKGDT